jgi:hypothetical protein
MGYKIAAAGSTPAFLKIIVTGPSSAGKTRFGIDGGTYKITKDGKLEGDGMLWPDLIVVNAERGVSAYEEPFEGMFAVVNTKKISELNDLVDDILSGKVKCGTLLIDTWTTFRNTVMSAVDKDKSKRGGDMGMKEFGKVNKALEEVQDKLDNMPCHVILVVHETDVINAEKTDEDKAVAARKAARNTAQSDVVKMEANKKVARWADVTLWFEPKRSANSPTRARVAKTRAIVLDEDKDGYINNPSYAKTFKEVAERWAARGNKAEQLNQREAEQDALDFANKIDAPEVVEPVKPAKTSSVQPQTFANENTVKRWVQKWMRMPYNLQHDQILGALGVGSYRELGDMTFQEADEILIAAFATPASEG